ncbi:MAG TPA: hypothetical protein VN915_00615 [Elusimicrobiota bacterium]|nr:hypothetical protein [Elusimicrobiota bacterium]
MSRNDLLVLGLWCAAVLALLAPVWASPGAAFFNHGDLYTYHVPLRALTASGLQAGHLPFWNPYILLGEPHAANPQAALFYPAALLEAFFPVVPALVWDQVLHLLWAGAGMFLLCRAQRLDRAGAFALASAFALSPFLIYRVTAGIPTLLAALSWAPWLWLAWLSGSGLLLAGCFALQLLSGHAQFLVINGAAMAAWALFHDGRGALYARLAAAGAGALALTAAQWPLTAQFLRLSVRSAWSGAMSGAYALPPAALWTWLNPAALGTPAAGTWQDVLSVFYETCGGWAGPVALAMGAYGLARGKRRLPASVLALAGVFLAMGPRGPLSRAVLGFAVLSYLRTPSRWLFLTLWAVLLLAGAGAAALHERHSPLGGRRLPRGARLLAALLSFAPLALWDAPFLRPQDPAPYVAPRAQVAEALAGRAQRVLTAPELANPNKAILYRMMNVNGYEAFYLKDVPAWAASVEGAAAADASRVYASKWRSPAAVRAGVAAVLTPGGFERGAAWPLAVFLDAAGNRVLPDPQLWLESPERWRVFGRISSRAVKIAMSIPVYPGWRARLDGAPVEISRWDGMFSSVEFPASLFARPKALEGTPGDAFDLRLEFVPTGWALLAALTALAWAAWLAALARRLPGLAA